MKVLVADDDLVSQRILKSYLEKWGYEFVLVGDGAQAWELLQEQDISIVLTDWLMPLMDGVELIRRIREREGDVPYVYAILLTAKSQKEDLVEGMDAGADDFLSKPFDRDELRVRLREGERVVHLERTLAEQYRQLHQAQFKLKEQERLSQLGSRAASIADQMLLVLDEVQALPVPGDQEAHAEYSKGLLANCQKVRALVQGLRSECPREEQNA
jgi:DNA-binding response OmpR family regulator